jgi:ppGpp synthetase/RelA/SpoT-type nucleotidyltranferase
MTINLDWFRKQIDAFNAAGPLYQRSAAALLPILEHAARLYCRNAIVQVRVKTVQSFAEKALRKRDRHPDPVRQFTDLCGGRIITHLQSEVEAVCAFLRAHFTVDDANSGDALARLRRKEFGYRSVHYVVQFRPGAFPTRLVPVEVADELHGLKAEVQVRTLLQHAWADVDHERLYRALFRVPEQMDRESARLAAAMETADEAFGRFAAALDEYRTDFSAGTDPAALREEAEILQEVRRHAPGDMRLAHQLARVLVALQDWDAVARLRDELPDARDAGLLCCLGQALCERHRADPGSAGYEDGRKLLREAAVADPRRAEPHVRLAETCARDEERAEVFDHFARAFEADPTDPQALCGYVRHRAASERGLAFLDLLRPAVAAAVQRCRAQEAARINLPWALYHLGELSVLLGGEHTLPGLEAYLRAAAAGTARPPLEHALRGLELLRCVEPQRPELATARRLLTLALAVRHPDAETQRRLSRLASAVRPPAGPVVIVAGGCDPALQREMEDRYRGVLHGAFLHFRGTVLSGGTREGISGLVGELGERYAGRITTVGYLPEVLPADGTANRDPRYHELRTTTGRQFSVLEPVQAWLDMVAAGVDPRRVRVLGINGGRIAAFEYRLALLLGARVGLVRDSGRRADALAAEAEAEPITGLALLPADRMTLGAFLTVEPLAGLSPEQRELMARRIHEDYCKKNPPRTPPGDIASTPWDELPQEHQEENLRQANDYQRKLAAVGLRAVPVAGREVRLHEFTSEEVEFLAEMEHGRYVASKLLAGWTLGPHGERSRPSLVAWKDLPEAERRKDREATQNMPQLLKELGFEIQPVGTTIGR